MADVSANGVLSIGLAQKYRPRSLKTFYGQQTAIPVLQTWQANGLPHTVLLTGPSGVGKTTLARIFKRWVGCSDVDFNEMDIADLRGIDNVRDVRSRMRLMPIAGPCRMWLLDEVQQATRDSQQAMLKALEDTPTHVYFILCTTDPQKLLPTILTRCKTVALGQVKEEDLTNLVLDVALKEGVELSQEVAERIASCAGGSPRNALSLLESVLYIEDEQAQLDAVQKSSVKQQGIDLARALVNEQTTWPVVAEILRNCDDDAESLRYQVLGYAESMMVGRNGRKPCQGAALGRAYRIISAFRFDFFNSKRAGLAAACYEVLHGG